MCQLYPNLSTKLNVFTFTDFLNLRAEFDQLVIQITWPLLMLQGDIGSSVREERMITHVEETVYILITYTGNTRGCVVLLSVVNYIRPYQMTEGNSH